MSFLEYWIVCRWLLCINAIIVASMFVFEANTSEFEAIFEYCCCWLSHSIPHYYLITVVVPASTILIYLPRITAHTSAAAAADDILTTAAITCRGASLKCAKHKIVKWRTRAEAMIRLRSFVPRSAFQSCNAIPIGSSDKWSAYYRCIYPGGLGPLNCLICCQYVVDRLQDLFGRLIGFVTPYFNINYCHYNEWYEYINCSGG